MEELSKYDFKHFGSFEIKEERILYTPFIAQKDSKDIHKVYVWVQRGTEERVIYVGKTKNSVQKRMAEHRQGFKGKLNNGSVSGSKKYNFLIKAFSQGYSFEVWAREAELGTIEINGLISNKLSFFSIEEEYFIEQFKPILNK